MSHSVKVTLIADQQIRLLGELINIHDLVSIHLDENGKITEFTERTQNGEQRIGGSDPAESDDD